TPAYMSPEQAEGRLDQLGPKSDIYSMGATLYHLLTGCAPCEGEQPGEIIRKVKAGEIPHPRSLDARIAPGLEAICLKALALRPEDRYETAEALKADLERWLADEPIAARRDPWMSRVWRGIRKHRTLMTTAAAVVLVSLLALVIGYRQLATANRRTERWLDQAMKSYEDYVSGFNEQAIKSSRLPKELLESLLEKPRLFYEQLTTELASSPTPTSRESCLLARSRGNLGRILPLLPPNPDSMWETPPPLPLCA